MNHPTKEKGDLGLFMAHADIAKKGYMILHPMTEHAPFDLVAYKDGKFIRVQVKHRPLIKGRIEVRLDSEWSDSKGIHTRPMDKEQVDMVCVYCLGTNACYYFDPKQFKASVRIRVTPSKNSQKVNVHLAESFMMI